MASAQLNVREIDSTHYSLAFETDGGRVVCEISVEGTAKALSAAERKRAALHRAKLLARAFHEAIVDS